MGNITPAVTRDGFSQRTVRRRGSSCLRLHRRYSAGFTMIEVMIVVAIIAVLAAIAYPSYTKYMIKTNRSAAEGCLSEYANYMERYYTTNLRYDQDSAGTSNTLPTLDCASQTSSRYSYGFGTAATSTAYTLQATPTGAQTADTQCGTLQLDQTGARSELGTDTTTSDCW